MLSAVELVNNILQLAESRDVERRGPGAVHALPKKASSAQHPFVHGKTSGRHLGSDAVQGLDPVLEHRSRTLFVAGLEEVLVLDEAGASHLGGVPYRAWLPCAFPRPRSQRR
jgi:hypothetical protein